jgi:hypothetical protein|tara:strand:- start:258 stop:413 length:156 start_codon:yes stop_codon:yes gene_type:complete
MDYNYINTLLKHIKLLKEQLKDRDNTINKLREELSIVKQTEANRKWIELDD